MRYRRTLPLVALALVGLLGGAVVGSNPGSGLGPDAGDGAPDPDRLVSPDGTASYVWPYTSRSRSVEGRTLALNVVVRGTPERVRRVLEARSEADWTAVEGDADVGTDSVVDSPWNRARGAARYTYVTSDPRSAGEWVRAEYQLGTGPYLGRRIHVRAYPSPSGNWTALQAHAEYWDWFRLRHTVTGVSEGGRFVERDLRDRPFVDGVSREYHGFDGGGSDGWVTVVEYSPVPFLLGVALPIVGRYREHVRDAAHPVVDWGRGHAVDVALPVAVVAVVLGVRAAGLAAEEVAPTVDPKLFAAVLYPVLVGGPPAVVRLLARGRPATRAALLAGAGLGVAVVLDLGGVGVTVVPVRLAVHRVALVGALGLFALGVAREDRRSIGFGAAAWTAALAAPLLGVV